MKRGVVMSIHKQHAVVVTADGQFLRASIQGTPQIGEEITFEEEYKTSRTFKPAYWYTSAAAIVLVLLLPLLMIVQRDAHPVVAYLSMDINPSVEIGVDGNGKVRELRALNNDGQLIIKGLVFKGVSLEIVAASILERAKGSHYLDTPNKDIFITSVLLDDSAANKLDYESILAEKVDQALKSLLAKLAAEAVSANVTTLTIPNELREEAEANGISSGKMAVYLMAKEEGYKLEIDQLKQQSIDKVTEPLGGVKTIVDNASDTSKEKLKELVVREQKEKAKQQKDEKESSSANPAATPKANKPVKTEKPVINGEDKAEETDKPGKNGSWDKKTTPSPESSDKPSVTSKTKGNKKDDNRNKDNDGSDDDDNDNDDKDGKEEENDDHKSDRKDDSDDDIDNRDNKQDDSRNHESTRKKDD
ncbi:anti-sigma factor domain-containing protein [Paenibacillus prosopidis]|uniref:Anti-sigma factor-like protein n=1 Tax=Paenibacillus prosopidis TaxID=630520 RepID=A0A368VJZ7_9BACL|nr:anti-sigma factor domain-containing protein [Paenibacillus prosopidis]RCW41723.1 anti-sigma factor-like protein [Paenibacillus prosopidis]